MLNSTIKIKVKQRLNKLASNDYDNIQDWQVIEAFNKGMSAWVRRQLAGTNLSKTGDEGSKRKIDDLQVLLVTLPIGMSKTDGYYKSNSFPKNYMEWKRISTNAISGCCKDPRKMMVYLAHEADVDLLLRDQNKKPSFEWAETFCTMSGNTIKVYTDNKFDISNTQLIYYKLPRKIEIKGVSNPYTGEYSLAEVECEFKDDVVEILIDECVKILSGDIEDFNANSLADNSVESSN